MALLARPLHSKHGLQNTEDLNQRVMGQNPQTLNQAISIDCSHLISHHVTLLSIKQATYAKRIGVAAWCEWRHNKRAEMGVQLIW